MQMSKYALRDRLKDIKNYLYDSS